MVVSQKKLQPHLIKRSRWERYKLIAYIYQSELEERRPDCSKINTDPNLTPSIRNNLTAICFEYDQLRERISTLFKRGYTWDNNLPMIRSILIVGCFLMTRIDAPIVIDELIEYTKIYVPGNFFKFVNGILDNYKRVNIKTKEVLKKDEREEY